jgi:hypothetical protein
MGINIARPSLPIKKKKPKAPPNPCSLARFRSSKTPIRVKGANRGPRGQNRDGGASLPFGNEFIIPFFDKYFEHPNDANQSGLLHPFAEKAFMVFSCLA